MSQQHQDLTRSTLAVLFIGGLIAASFWLLRPFLPAIIWAVTLVVATWPLMLQVQHYAGHRRSVAVLVMTLGLLLVLIVPFWLAISTIVANRDEIADLLQTILSLRVPSPPDWLAQVPLVGEHVAEAWGRLTSAGVQDLAPKLMPYAGSVTQWFVSAMGSLGAIFVHVLLTVAIAAVMYASGEQATATAIRFGRRLGGERGEMAVRLAGQAIRSVALGVVVTALVQSLLGGIGLAIAGMPFTAVLTALMFMLCLAQVGPTPVLIPAIAWMYYTGDTVWATVLLAFAIIAMAMDNFLRPMLIRKGADLPMLLILGGVIGGLIAFGPLGIFVGPTVLAIAYTLLTAWMAEGDAAMTAPVPDSPSRPPIEATTAPDATKSFPKRAGDA
jgi:predicted PurR-regulated permease PerM